MRGNLQKGICAEPCPGATEKPPVTGMPRFGPHAPEDEPLDAPKVAAIREEQGAFILVCTQSEALTFGCDEILPFGARHAAPFGCGVDAKVDKLRAMVENRASCGSRFTGLFSLAFEVPVAFKDPHVILSVRPSGDRSIHDRPAQHLPTTSGLQEGDIRPTRRAASVVVQPGSTTGVAALVSGKPTFDRSVDGVLDDPAIMGARDAGLRIPSIDRLSIDMLSIDWGLRRTGEALHRSGVAAAGAHAPWSEQAPFMATINDPIPTEVME